ncbi:MAG: DUF6174 domain-containing protein [Gemmatimonadaceae bacterium]
MNEPRSHLLRIRLSRSAALACALGAALGFSSGCSITEPSGRAAEAMDLSRNRQRWASANLHDYEFDYQLRCFCAPDATEPVHIVVRGDAISSVVRSRDGLPAVTRFGGWPRVDELFATVQRRLEQGAARVDVTYDVALGYPRSITVDIELLTADDESEQVASNLRAAR